MRIGAILTGVAGFIGVCYILTLATAPAWFLGLIVLAVLAILIMTKGHPAGMGLSIFLVFSAAVYWTAVVIEELMLRLTWWLQDHGAELIVLALMAGAVIMLVVFKDEIPWRKLGRIALRGLNAILDFAGWGFTALADIVGMIAITGWYAMFPPVLRCTKCQTALPPDAQFCINCRKPVANIGATRRIGK